MYNKKYYNRQDLYINFNYFMYLLYKYYQILDYIYIEFQ